MATKTFKIGLNNADKTAMAQDVYERLVSMCFDEYDPSEIYNTGDFVVYENPTDTFKLYKCNSNDVTGAWDSSKWDLATFQDLVDDIEDAVAFVNDKANVDGNYPTMTVGFADNLTPYGDNSGIDDDMPFVFQTSGGESDIGSSAQIKKLEGTSKAWNQNALPLNSNKWNASSAYGTLSNATETSVLYTRNQSEQTNNVSLIFQAIDGGYGSIAGHKYLIKTIITPSATFKFRAYIGTYGNVYYPTANVKNYFAEIITANLAGYIQFISENGGHLPLGGTILFENIQCFDLTLIYGAGNEPTTVDEFEKDFPLSYYPYDAGSIVSSKVKGYKVVGYNAFDGIWLTDSSTNNLSDYIKVVGGQTYTLEYVIPTGTTITFKMIKEYDVSKNLLRTQYLHIESAYLKESFELLENTQYIQLDIRRSAGSKPENVCLHLTWDESKTGYEPYWSETYQLPNVELRAVNDIKDELLPDGTLTRRIGIVDLGTLYWIANATRNNYRMYTSGLRGIIKGYTQNVITPKYLVTTSAQTYEDKVGIAVDSDGTVFIYDENYNQSTSAATFKTAMSGVYLIYELATPTTEQVDPYQENTLIDDWGTQEWLSDNTIILPQPAEFFYSVDYKAFVDSLGGREDIDYTAENIVSQEQLSKVVEGTRPVTLALASDNLTPYSEESGATETNPFVFQSAGGGADIGSQAYLKGLRGNSVAFNQLIQNGNFADTSNWTGYGGSLSASNNIGTYTVSSPASSNRIEQVINGIVSGHKYLISYYAKSSKNTIGNLLLESSIIQTNVSYTTTRAYYSFIFTSAASGNLKIRPYVNSDQDLAANDTVTFENFEIFDLTQMFGAGNEPTTALEFNRLFPNTYYEYNVGELKSCKVSKVVNVGYNQFNKSDVSLRYNSVYIDSSGYINVGGTNYSLVLPIIAGQKYTVERKTKISARFRIATCPNIPTELYRAPHSAMDNDALSLTVQSGAEDRYLVINLSTNETEFLNQLENLCVHLTWDNSRTGYESYEKHEYNLPNVELKSAGSVYDELKPDGTLIRRIGVVDLGTLNYVYDATNSRFYSNTSLSNVKVPSSNTNVANCLCSIYKTRASDDTLVNKGYDKIVSIGTNGSVRLKDTQYSNPTTFKTAMSGVYLFYELAEYVETQDDDYKYQEVQDIDDFGTQEFLYDNDIDIPVPQGNEFFYPVDYKAFIDSLGGRDDIEYAADKVVSQTQLTQALSTFLSSIQGYDATKTQTLKNVNGVFQWVDD